MGCRCNLVEVCMHKPFVPSGLQLGVAVVGSGDWKLKVRVILKPALGHIRDYIQNKIPGVTVYFF